MLLWPLAGTGIAIILRVSLDHSRTVATHRNAMQVQQALRGRLYDKAVALGPAWFGADASSP
jgi:ATP-binding cassette, subfamily B, bacterial